MAAVRAQSGQADTVQGELIRAVERLRDEAYRNGNVDWGDGHVILVEDPPEESDGPYDRLTDRVVEWSRAHPEPVPREPTGPAI